MSTQKKDLPKLLDRNAFRKLKSDEVFELEDIVVLKKIHPCGSNQWKILRVGADFRLECLGCGHQIMMSRRDTMKAIREIHKQQEFQN